MPPPDMPPSIQKPQKSSPISSRAGVDQRFGVQIAGPGNDGLHGAVEIALGQRAEAANIPVAQLSQHLVENADGLLAARSTPLRTAAGTSR